MGGPSFNSSARRSERVALHALVMLRRSGQLNFRVRVYDASLHGCRVEFVDRPELDEQLWVKFDELQPIAAEVCWVEGFSAGLNFRQPIHPAVFDRLITKLSAPPA
jgi:hypothetical protein